MKTNSGNTYNVHKGDAQQINILTQFSPFLPPFYLPLRFFIVLVDPQKEGVLPVGGHRLVAWHFSERDSPSDKLPPPDCGENPRNTGEARPRIPASPLTQCLFLRVLSTRTNYRPKT